MEKLFTYGTLQDPKIQLRLFKRTLKGGEDVLIDFEMGSITSQGETFNCADYKPGGEIKGVVYELSREELEIADKYELEDYKRIKTKLRSGVESWVYIRNVM